MSSLKLFKNVMNAELKCLLKQYKKKMRPINKRLYLTYNYFIVFFLNNMHSKIHCKFSQR